MAISVFNPIITKSNIVPYYTSAPVNFTLLASGWNGTTYELQFTDYVMVNKDAGAQLGLPTNCGSYNAENMINAALTMPRIYDSTNSSTGVTTTYVTISAVNQPTVDITIALYGLTPATAASQEETV